MKSIIQSLSSRASLTLRLALILLLVAVGASAQEVFRLTGKVTDKDTKEPLLGVSIVDSTTHRAIAVTDMDGRFAVDVHSGSILRFSMVGLQSQVVKVKSSQKYIEVKLEQTEVALQELVVSAKRITDKIQPEPTDIEVKGNYLHVKTRVRVPREMFSHNNRLVVQPVIYNVTRREEQLMRPMVYDARTYNRTQDRLYDYRMDEADGDPLAQYVVVKTPEKREKGRTNDIIGYADSAYVQHVKDDYACNVYMAIENYNRIIYRDTTIIAQGTVNPLRWLDYSFAADLLADEAYWPKPEVQMRDSRGEVNLRFPINKAMFDASDPNNVAEISKMREQIELISADKDATLQSLTIEGTSSPDGRYNSNLQLARKRMDYAVQYLRQLVPERAQRGMTFSSAASVAPWSRVAELMRADSLTEEAQQVEQVIKRWRDFDDQSRNMRKLPFYRSLLMERYLPRLRHVGYVMNYSVFRQLTLDEIRSLYADDYKQLTKYEFFRLYRAEEDSARREKVLRQALEIYPSFMVAANDLAALLINRRMADPDLLRPFVGKEAPSVVNTNQMIALLNAGLFTAADSLSAFVPDNEHTHMLLAVNAVLNGRFEGHYETIARTGLRNQLVVLLAMKRNEEALKVSRQLPDDEALTHYLRAVCLNRLEQMSDAYDELTKAIQMDPSLKQVAHTDGDVNDLLLDSNDNN